MKCFSLTSSKRRTPWDGKKFLSPYEKFIKDQYLGVYSSRHPILSSTGETKFLNSFQVFHCRYCGSENFIRYGHTSNGINRYLCKDCGRTFTITTGTIFEDHKISCSEWVEQVLQIIGYESSSLASKNGRNSFTTTKYWNAKIFKVLQAYQENIVLSGRVLIVTLQNKISAGGGNTADNNRNSFHVVMRMCRVELHIFFAKLNQI